MPKGVWPIDKALMPRNALEGARPSPETQTGFLGLAPALELQAGLARPRRRAVFGHCLWSPAGCVGLPA